MKGYLIKKLILFFIILIFFLIGCKQKEIESESELLITDTTETEIETIFEETTELENMIESDIKINVLVEPSLKFDFVGFFSDGMALVRKDDDKFGFVDKTGEVIIAVIYDEPIYFSDGLARVKIGDKYGLINKFGEDVVPVEYDMVGEICDGMAWVLKGEKYGFADKTDIIIPLIYNYNGGFYEYYDTIVDFSEGLAAVVIGGKCGFIDKTGELVISAIYDGEFYKGEWGSNFPRFKDGLVRVVLGEYPDRKCGYINKSGEVVVPFDYDWMGDYYGQYKFGLTRAVKDDKMGFLDLNGNVAVPFIYDLLFDFNGELAFAWKLSEDERGCYINKEGVEVTPYEYNGNQWSGWVYEPSYAGLTIACKDEKFGCLDKDGNIVIPFVYDWIKFGPDELFYCHIHLLDSEYDPGYADKNGNFIISEYLLCEAIGDGLFIIGNNRKYGYADLTGKIVIPPEYDFNEAFREGLARVGIGSWPDSKYGFIDKNGNIIVPLIYYHVLPFSEGLAWVQKDGLWGILEIT